MKRSATLYNIIMPVWLLLGFIPYLWPVVLLGNYAIDSLVLYLGMKWIGLAEKKPFYKAHIGKVWGCGFLGDLPGVLLMLLPTFAQDWLWQPGAQASQNALWHFFHDQLSALMWNPFTNLWGTLWALLAVGVFGGMLWTMPRYKQVQAGLDKVLGATRENLTGVRVIRAFGREAAENQRFQQENNALTKLQEHVGKISALMNPVTYVIINLAAVALIWVGAVRVDTAILTQGAVVALLNYMSQILVELIKLANLIINITKALACMGRVQAVLDTPSSMEAPQAFSGTAGRGGSVEFRGVGLTYQGAGEASLSGLDFSVKPGDTVGIIGGTGSGKSSLVNLIPRFYDATQGAVLVDGRDVREFPLSQLRQRVGVVPQRAQLFSGTIRENLLWGNPNATEADLWQALETAQARDFVEEKPGGLDEPVAQGGRNFSGGQRQRLTIARALVRKPEILILDDSASALDFATDAKLRRAIREMEGGPTVFIVSQRASSIRYADTIIVLDDGQAVGIGTHQQLLESCQVYREIFQSQYESKRKEAAV